MAMRTLHLLKNNVFALAVFLLHWPLAFAQNEVETELGPCAEVAAQVAQYHADPNREDYVDAQAAFDCINQIPLDATAAISVISIIKEYLVFQSTLSYQKSPLDSYQQPGVDLISDLDSLAKAVGEGKFDTQYGFEVAMHSIFAQAHDSHLAPEFGLLGLFEWRLLHTIVSVSADGLQLPQVFVGTDTRSRRWRNASPIVELQGEPVFTYLRKYANARNLGTIDPHADWNKIMLNTNSNAAKGYDEPRHAFDSTPIYNGPVLSGRFANGTGFEWRYYAVTATRLPKDTNAGWIAEHVGLVKPKGVAPLAGLSDQADTKVQIPLVASEPALITEASDPPNFEAHKPMFGLLPPQSEEQDVSQASNDFRWARGERYQAIHRDLFDFDGREKDAGVTGIIFDWLSFAVLSIPVWYSQEEHDSEVSSIGFSEDVDKFISIAKESNVTKVLIDLRGDSEEGFLFQAFDTAKRFFPDLEPSISFRARASPQLDLLGSSINSHLQGRREARSSMKQARLLQHYHSMAPLSASQMLDADGKNWESWADFFGPDDSQRDKFTKRTRYNISDLYTTFSSGPETASYNSTKLDYEQPWPAEDILLLHDGTCGSTCAIFSEILATDAGVKSIAVGGLPLYGPMQGVGGTRGGFMVSWRVLSDIAEDIRLKFARRTHHGLSKSKQHEQDRTFDGFTKADINRLPTPLSNSPWRLSGKVNILDSIRASHPDNPLHFMFNSSDCRLFFTREMLGDVLSVWFAGLDFLNGNASMCVPGSVRGPGGFSEDFSAGSVWDRLRTPEVPPLRPEQPTMRPGNEAWMRDGDPSNPPTHETWWYTDDKVVHFL
ncbi:Peptidase S41 family protein ustP [Paramyrothecium foliicola]|nr:Peptidase S41 family protein ustP [Paramyrothecium foliicola]